MAVAFEILGNLAAFNIRRLIFVLTIGTAR